MPSTRGAVVDDASERLDGIGGPDESSGIEQSERVVVGEPAVERGGVDSCLRSGLIHQGERVRAVEASRLPREVIGCHPAVAKATSSARWAWQAIA